jgi:hypothetical protein
MRGHKGVVVEMGIGGVDSFHFGDLAWGELLVGIESPGACHEALALEDPVDAGEAAAEVVAGVEDGGVGVGQR